MLNSSEVSFERKTKTDKKERRGGEKEGDMGGAGKESES